MNGSDSSRVPLKTPEFRKNKRFPMMLEIFFPDGGVVPKELSGLYKKPAEAQRAIDMWVKGYDRKKIYPFASTAHVPVKEPEVVPEPVLESAPEPEPKDEPQQEQRSVEEDGEAIDAS